MATITSLKFDISSQWDGSAVRRAQGDIKMLNQDLRRLNNSRVRVNVDVDTSAALRQLNELNAAVRDRRATIDVDLDTAAAEARIAALTRDRRTRIDIDVDRSQIDEIANSLGRVTIAAGNAGQSAQGMGRMMKLAVAGFAASLIALPGLINVVGGALMASLPVAFIGIAAIAQRENATIVASFQHLKNDVITETKAMTAPLVDELAGALHQVHDAFWRIKPALTDAFSAAQPLVAPLVGAMTDLVENSMPGVVSAMQNMLPVVEHVRNGFGNFGTSMSNMFAAMGQGAAGLGMALEVTFTHIGVLMQRFGEAARDMSQTGTFVWGELLSGLNGMVDGYLDGLTSIMNIASGPMGVLMHTLGDSLGGVFRELLPPIGQLVSILAQVLTPVLTNLNPIITLVGDVLNQMLIAVQPLVPPIIDLVNALGAGLLEALRALLPSLIPVVQEMVNGLLPVLPLITSAVEFLSPILTAIAIGWAEIFEWLSPAAPIIAGVAAAWWLVNAAMAANPIVLLAVAIAALVGGIVYLATKTQFFQQVWGAVWGFVNNTAMTVWNFLQTRWDQFIQHFVNIWQTVSTFFVTLWNTVWGAISGAAQAVWQGLQDKWNAFTAHISAAWSALWGAVQSIASTVWGALQAAWSAVTNAFVTAWNMVGNVLRTAWEAIWFAIRMVLATILTTLTAAWQLFGDTLVNIWNMASAIFRAAWDAVWNAVKAVGEAIWNGLKWAWENFLNGIRVVWDAVSGALRAAWDAVWNGIKAAAETIWGFIRGAWDALLNGVRAVWDAWSGAFRATWEAIWNGIKAVGEAIWNGIKAAWDWLTNTIRAVWDAFAGALQNAWNTVWSWVRDTAAGIWDWISGKWTWLTNTIQEVLSNAVNWIKDIWGKAWDWVSEKATAVWDWISGKFGEFKDGVQGTIQGLVDKVKEIWDKITGIFQAPVDGIKNIWNGFAGHLGLPKFAEGGPVEAGPALATGGRVSGAGTGTSDSIPARLSNGEHVWTAKEVRAAGGHRQVETMRNEVLAGGFAGGGATDWMWARVKEMNQGMQLTSSQRNGDSGFHGQGKAIDVSNGGDAGTPQMKSVANTIADTWGAKTLELIHSPFNKNIKNGKNVGDGMGLYGGGTMAGHRNHVHWAVDGPLDGRPGAPTAGGFGEGSSGPTPEQIEAHKKATEQIRALVNKTNAETGSKTFGMTIHEMNRAANENFIGPVSATQLLPNAQNKFGHYTPAGDVHGAGVQKEGVAAVAKFDEALAAASAGGGAAAGAYGAGWQFYVDEIKAAAKERGLDRKAAKIAVGTTLVESNLRMLASRVVPESLKFPHDGLGSDHDSIGLFQQRQAGWGTVAQRMNAKASAGMFLNALIGVGGWQGMGEGAAAQAVQRSAYPAKYQPRMAEADRLVGQYAEGTASAKKGWNMVGEKGPEMVKFSGGETVKTFDEIIAAVKDSAVGNTNQIIDRFTAEINGAIDRVGGQHTDALERLVSSLSGEVKSFVQQAIEGQKVSGEELAARLNTELRNFIDGALNQIGANVKMELKLPNGTSANANDVANAVRSQVFPELERLIHQQVGKR